MGNTPTRRDSRGRKIRRRLHPMSMRAAAMRRVFKAQQAQIAAGSNRDDLAETENA